MVERDSVRRGKTAKNANNNGPHCDARCKGQPEQESRKRRHLLPEFREPHRERERDRRDRGEEQRSEQRRWLRRPAQADHDGKAERDDLREAEGEQAKWWKARIRGTGAINPEGDGVESAMRARLRDREAVRGRGGRGRAASRLALRRSARWPARCGRRPPARRAPRFESGATLCTTIAPLPKSTRNPSAGTRFKSQVIRSAR